MKTETIYCDRCKKKTTDNSIKIENLNGLVFEIGYSMGGWGSRQDFIPKFTMEVCRNCFKDIEIKINELKETLISP